MLADDGSIRKKQKLSPPLIRVSISRPDAKLSRTAETTLIMPTTRKAAKYAALISHVSGGHNVTAAPKIASKAGPPAELITSHGFFIRPCSLGIVSQREPTRRLMDVDLFH